MDRWVKIYHLTAEGWNDKGTGHATVQYHGDKTVLEVRSDTDGEPNFQILGIALQLHIWKDLENQLILTAHRSLVLHTANTPIGLLFF